MRFKRLEIPLSANTRALKSDLSFQLFIARAWTKVTAEMNSRLVFGIGCVPMILIGIGLGIVQRGGHLLGAFGVSCIPAALLGAAIVSGRRLMEGMGTQGSGGVLVMWGGLVFLVLLTAWLYRRLVRQ